MGAIDELLARHSAGLTTTSCCDADQLGAKPRLRVVVLTCMDTRIDPARILGLRLGDVHVLRNGGGLVTDDALRSLVLSQHKLGTQEIMVIQHTDCGLEGLHGADLAGRLEAQTGEALHLDLDGFDDVETSVRDGLKKVRDCAWLARRDAARGFVYDVRTTRLHEIS